jgi:hypothetical protein
MLASTYQSSDEWSSSAVEDSGAKVSDCSLSTSKNTPIIRPGAQITLIKPTIEIYPL